MGLEIVKVTEINDIMNYGSQSGSASALKKYVATEACTILGVAWQMGSAPAVAGKHQVRVNGGTWTDISNVTTTALTGYLAATNTINLSAGDTLEIVFNQGHSDSHTATVLIQTT